MSVPTINIFSFQFRIPIFAEISIMCQFSFSKPDRNLLGKQKSVKYSGWNIDPQFELTLRHKWKVKIITKNSLFTFPGNQIVGEFLEWILRYSKDSYKFLSEAFYSCLKWTSSDSHKSPIAISVYKKIELIKPDLKKHFRYFSISFIMFEIEWKRR